MQVYQHELKAFTSAVIKQLNPTNKKAMVFAGMIMSVRQVMTKTGRRMGILSVEDHTGRIDVTVFSKLYEQVREHLFKDNMVVVKGEISPDDFTGGLKCVADELTPLAQARAERAKSIYIELHAKKDVENLLSQLPQVIKSYSGGSCPIIVAYHHDAAKAELRLGPEWRVTPTDQLIEQLADLSHAPVKVKY